MVRHPVSGQNLIHALFHMRSSDYKTAALATAIAVHTPQLGDFILILKMHKITRRRGARGVIMYLFNVVLCVATAAIFVPAAVLLTISFVRRRTLNAAQARQPAFERDINRPISRSLLV